MHFLLWLTWGQSGPGYDEILHKHFAAPQWLLEEMWERNRATVAGGEAQDLPAGFPSSQSSQTCLLSSHQPFPFDQALSHLSDIVYLSTENHPYATLR